MQRQHVIEVTEHQSMLGSWGFATKSTTRTQLDTKRRAFRSIARPFGTEIASQAEYAGSIPVIGSTRTYGTAQRVLARR